MRVPAQTIPSVEPTAVPIPDQRIQASPAAFGGATAEALGNVSKVVGQSGDVLFRDALQKQELYNETAVNDAVNNQLLAQGTKILRDPQTGFFTKRGKDALDAYPDVQKQLSDNAATIRDGLANDMQRKMFDRQAMRINRMFVDEAAGHADQQQLQWAKDTAQGSINNVINTGALSWNDPNKVDYFLGRVGAESFKSAELELGASGAGTIDNPSPAAKAIMAKSQSAYLKSVINQATAAEVGNHAPLGTASKIFDTYKNRLDANDMATMSGRLEYHNMVMQNRVDAAARKASATIRVGVDRDISNAVAMVGDGKAPSTLPDDKTIDLAYPQDPERAALIKQQTADIRTVGGKIASLPTMSPEKIIATTNELRPSEDDASHYAEKARVFSIWQKAVTGYAKNMKADPAATVMAANPDVAQHYAASIQNPQLFPTYAESVLGAQSAAGVAESDRHVLPATQVQSLAKQIEADPETAPAKIKQLATQYGDYWPQVWKDLTTTKGGLPAGYQALATVDDEGQAALLARALGEQGKTGKSLVDLLPPKAQKGPTGIDASIESAPEVRSLLSSISHSGGNAEMQTAVLNSIKTLAYANVVYGGKDAGTATEKAIDAFTSEYDFSMPGNPRVPVKVADTVKANARFALHNLADDMIAVPALYGQANMPKPEEYLSAIKAAPTWITSPHADALWLMDPWGRLVRGHDGNPVSVPFSGTLAPVPAIQPSSKDTDAAALGIPPSAVQ